MYIHYLLAICLTCSICSLTAQSSSPIWDESDYYMVEEGDVYKECQLDEAPAYLDGEKAMLNMLFSNLNYPAIAREKNITGTVKLQILVGKDGNLKDIQILERIGGGCDEAAKKAAWELGDKGFLPGMKDGRPVNVKMVLPVKFSLG